MPTKTPVVRVQYDHGDGRRHYELTAAKIRALTPRDGDQSGKVADSVPFATAQSLERQGLLQRRGPNWFITRRGREVGKRARLKRARQEGQ